MLFLLILLALLAYLVIRQPDDFRYSRSLRIAASAEKIFPHVNVLQNWGAWSPWAKLDPNAKNTFSGTPSGVSASMAWEGNNKVGAGSMTTKQAVPNTYLQFELAFRKPMKATNVAEFTFTELGNETLVVWSMSGKTPLMGKIMSLVFNCQKMMDEQFDKGLADLKKVSEAA